MRLRSNKESKDTFYDGLTGKPLDKSSRKTEERIWAKMREMSGMTNEQIDALPEKDFDELYEKAVELELG